MLRASPVGSGDANALLARGTDEVKVQKARNELETLPGALASS